MRRQKQIRDRGRIVHTMVHLALHFVLPLLVALVFYRTTWRHSWLLLVSTMLVDIDHLLATPIYDPARCSIGFHPLHTAVPFAVYVVLFALPLLAWLWDKAAPRERAEADRSKKPIVRTLHLVGLGLIIHMALDWSDCVL